MTVPNRIEAKPCSAYIDGRSFCRNGFPTRGPLCHGRSFYFGFGPPPHCLDDDYAPPHIIGDDGSPIFARSTP